jgi:hypothetical protein
LFVIGIAHPVLATGLTAAGNAVLLANVVEDVPVVAKTACKVNVQNFPTYCQLIVIDADVPPLPSQVKVDAVEPTTKVANVPVALGSVIVAVTASTGVSVVDPLVAPARTTVPISRFL